MDVWKCPKQKRCVQETGRLRLRLCSLKMRMQILRKWPWNSPAPSWRMKRHWWQQERYYRHHWLSLIHICAARKAHDTMEGYGRKGTADHAAEPERPVRISSSAGQGEKRDIGGALPESRKCPAAHWPSGEGGDSIPDEGEWHDLLFPSGGGWYLRFPAACPEPLWWGGVPSDQMCIRDSLLSP